MQLEIGNIYQGKVKGITNYGAFVEVPVEGGKPVTGMVHISEVANTYVSDIHDFLTEGQEVSVKILSVSPEGKINLSIKQTRSVPARQSRPVRPPRPAPVPAAAAPAAEPTFEDKLKQFLSVSEGKQSEFNRHMAGKRGGRRRK